MTRSPYMQQIMTETYDQVAIIAIKNGTITGAWEQAVAGRLEFDFKHGVSEAEVILQSTDMDAIRAATMVVCSKVPAMPEVFDIEFQYQEYLKRVNLNEADMHTQQRKQLRETFFGAVGAVLILLRVETQKLSEDDAVKSFQYMIDQVGEFFLKTNDQQN